MPLMIRHHGFHPRLFTFNPYGVTSSYVMKYAIIFVCQAGELEIKSLLLATSLTRYLTGDYELIAAVPQSPIHNSHLSDDSQTLLRTLKIRQVSITNPINEDYPIGNKIAALDIQTSAEQVIFLDSDILCLRTLAPHLLFSAAVNAKPADLTNFAGDLVFWQAVYNLFALPLPTRRVLSSVSGELMLPYFNAGVIAINNGLGFAQMWQACCLAIDAEPTITNKRPWLDQIALPIAIAKLGLAVHCLDERFNYPAHLKPLPTNQNALPFLCHYHWPAVIRREPLLNQLVIELTTAYPLLKKMLLTTPTWATLLKPYVLPPRRWLPKKWPAIIKKSRWYNNQPTAIITGMPRSGTSYLCRLLHQIPNCVVINEPTQIFPPLINELIPWSVAVFYQELRRDILDGKPIENKLQQGRVIEDTALIDQRSLYQPPVSRADFLLATKNTLSYLARLPQLKQVLPQTPIIACVRHPIDTIASWKTSFPHLQQVEVEKWPVGHLNDPLLAAWQRQYLAEIAATPQLAIKRALLWRYLAEIILMNAQQLHIIYYEELVTQPRQVLKKLLSQIPQAPSLPRTLKIQASTIRQRREVLDQTDMTAIFDICGENAVKLRYFS
jgi:hypothetical protein